MAQDILLKKLMLRTLLSRLILSHVGLLLILIPLLGVVPIYFLESQVVLVNLARQVSGQTVLVGELLKQDPAALEDETASVAFVERTVPLFPGELSVLDSQGHLLATSGRTEANEVGKFTDMPGLVDAPQGKQFSRVTLELTSTVEAYPQEVPATLGAEQGLEEVRVLARPFEEMIERIRHLEENGRYLLSNITPCLVVPSCGRLSPASFPSPPAPLGHAVCVPIQHP